MESAITFKGKYVEWIIVVNDDKKKQIVTCHSDIHFQTTLSRILSEYAVDTMYDEDTQLNTIQNLIGEISDTFEDDNNLTLEENIALYMKYLTQQKNDTSFKIQNVLTHKSLSVLRKLSKDIESELATIRFDFSIDTVKL
jgi:hypothetical protein